MNVRLPLGGGPSTLALALLLGIAASSLVGCDASDSGVSVTGDGGTSADAGPLDDVRVPPGADVPAAPDTAGKDTPSDAASPPDARADGGLPDAAPDAGGADVSADTALTPDAGTPDAVSADAVTPDVVTADTMTADAGDAARGDDIDPGSDTVTGCVDDAGCDDGVACTVDRCDAATGACTNTPDDAWCDDGAWCDGAEACAPGDDAADDDGCVAGAPPALGDGVPCTRDRCDEATDAVVHTPQDSACDDGNACTVDTCDAVTGCGHTPVAAGTVCAGGLGVCAVDGGCVTCLDDVVEGVDAGCGGATPLCVEGACVACVEDEDCPGALTCDAETRSCVGCAADADCDDGVACTVDLCDVAAGRCANQPTDAFCDDGALCDGVERCVPTSPAADADGCLAGTPLPVDDGIACTVDTCDDTAGGAVHTPDDAACDDGNPCTDDRCSAAAGCVATPAPAGTACAGGFCDDAGGCAACVDSEVLFVDPGCDDARPACVAGTCEPCDRDEQCGDGLVCGVTSHTCVPCDAESDDCPLDCAGVPGGAATVDACGRCDADPTNDCIEDCGGQPCAACGPGDPAACDDFDPCTEDRCVGGACVWETAPLDGAACDDRDACTVDTVCDGGVCGGGALAACDAPCHTGVCDPLFGCELVADGTPCDDGNPASTGDYCDAEGVCKGLCESDGCSGRAVSCSSLGCLDDPRGWDLCEAWALPAGSSCADDGDPCTEDRCDGSGGCDHEPIPGCVGCDDLVCDGPCHSGACSETEGCLPVADGTPCDDGNPRTEGDACRAGSCAGGCPSFFDSCRRAVLRLGGGCEDVIYAEEGAPCVDDGDPCTADVCDGAGGCVHVPALAEGEACDHPCGPGSCDSEGHCLLAEDHCADEVSWPDSACWSAVCDVDAGACVRVSDDETCLDPSAVCMPELGLCDADRCGDGWCGSDEAFQVGSNAFVNDCAADCPEPCLNGDPDPETCVLHFPDVELVGAWRAHQSTAYGWAGSTAHQTETFTGMLDDGIRWLHLLVDYCQPGATSGALCLCGRDDDCPSDHVPMETLLEELAAWLAAHHNEIVALQLDEYVGDDDLRTAFADAGLADLIYRRTSPPGTYETWPMNLHQMIGSGRRLVVFAEPWLSPRNLFLAEETTTPDAEGPGHLSDAFDVSYADWACADHARNLPTDEGRWRESFQGIYAVKHVILDGGVTSWTEAACYNRYGHEHRNACAELYPVTVTLYQYYNSSSEPLYGVPNGRDYADRCIWDLEGCTTDADCDVGVCGGLFICINCVDDGDCPDDQHCSTAWGACISDLDDGAVCTNDSQCRSGNCGVLCYSCATHDDCDDGEWCDAFGGCQPLRANGIGCLTGAECRSGVCYFGACADCDAHEDCPGDQFCTLDPLAGRSACADRKEAGAACTDDRECADDYCRNFVCADCESDYDCADDQFCDASGVCEDRWSAGHACLSDRECLSDACHLLFCAPCDSQDDCADGQFCTLDPEPGASACADRKENGSVCANDFECVGDRCTLFVCGDCVDDDQCDPSENCNAFNQCAPDVGNDEACLRDAQCTTGHCSAGFCAECTADEHCPAAEHCDAFGDCQPDVGNDEACLRDAQCATGHCSAGLCAECTSDSHCVASEHCDAYGDCQPDVGNNDACLRDAQCTTGHCSAGFCAECTSDAHCVASEHCDAFGDCQPDVGNNAACLRDAQCTTGICSAGFCAECTTHSHCGADGWCDAGGDCHAKKSDGSACGSGVECRSGCCGLWICGGIGC